MRKASGGLTAKILLGILVLSFLFWGISSQFFGYGAGTVARVGDAEVTAQEFDTALRQRMLDLGRRIGRGVSLEQARAMGLPQQVLSELVAEAALNDQAGRFNLGVSEERLAQAIANDPSFRGVGGTFDRLRFQGILRNLGINEDIFIGQVRDRIVRRQLATAIAGDVKAPSAMVEAYYRYGNETRTISYITLDESFAGTITDPGNAAFKEYFDQNKGIFGAPEYRVLGYISLQPEALADPASVADADVRASYDARIAEYTRAERRRILQIRYDTTEEAQSALDGLGADGTCTDLLAAKSLTASDVDLGLKTRAEIIDQRVAEEAFGGAADTLITVLDATLGPAVIKITQVEEGSVDRFEAVSEQIRSEFAQRDAADAILDMYDKIEDDRAGGATLAEIGRKIGLDYKTIGGVARDGGIRGGATSAGILGFATMVADAYLSDVG
ncbi:MAG: peptidylprolyl isomerase, partial [Alphaproteobacteria bacterium]